MNALKLILLTAILLVSITSALGIASMDVPTAVLLGTDSARSGTTVSTTFQIKNTGNETLTGLTSILTADTKFQLQLLNLPSTLGVNESSTLTLSGFVPSGFTARSLIGNVKINSLQISKTVTVDMQARNPLSIKKISFDIDGSGDSVKDGDTVDIAARPGSVVEIKVTIENLFDRQDDDIDIDNIDLTIMANSVDDGDDVDDSFDFDLRSEGEKTETMTFTLPLNTDEDTFSVDIDAEGDGSNGITYRATATVYFDVEKETHDIRITRFVITPSTVDCSPRTITLGTELTNYGRNQEDSVSYGIRQSILGIELNQFNIDLDNDLSDSSSKYRRDLRYTIPDSVKPGTYSVELTAFNDNNFAAFQVADVIVKACQDTIVTPPPVIQPPVVQPPVVPPVTGTTTAQPTTQPASQNLNFIIALAAINIVLLVVIIAVATRLMSR